MACISYGRSARDTAEGAYRKLRLEVVAGRVGARARETLSATVSPDDPGLDWCALAAGRMLRAPTVFEDVVKTN